MLSLGLRQPRKRVKLGQRYLLEKVGLSFEYMHQILYIPTDFQVSERLHGDPEFLGNYLIDCIIITS